MQVSPAGEATDAAAAAAATAAAGTQTSRVPGLDDVTVNMADAFGDINAMFQGALASEAPWQVPPMQTPGHGFPLAGLMDPSRLQTASLVAPHSSAHHLPWPAYSWQPAHGRPSRPAGLRTQAMARAACAHCITPTCGLQAGSSAHGHQQAWLQGLSEEQTQKILCAVQSQGRFPEPTATISTRAAMEALNSMFCSQITSDLAGELRWCPVCCPAPGSDDPQQGFGPPGPVRLACACLREASADVRLASGCHACCSTTAAPQLPGACSACNPPALAARFCPVTQASGVRIQQESGVTCGCI